MRDKQEDSFIKVIQIFIVAKFRQLTHPSGLNKLLNCSYVDLLPFLVLAVETSQKRKVSFSAICDRGFGKHDYNEYLYESVCRFTPSNEKIRFSDVKRALACILI